MTPRQLQDEYREHGLNISSALQQRNPVCLEAEEIIEFSYDLQAGSYVNLMQDERRQIAKRELTQEIARTILAYCPPQPESILEAGVGEATTLSGVMQALAIPKLATYGFDLSWSRLAHARRWLTQQGLTNYCLCTGSLFSIPFADNSVDVVYTANSIEPNGGHESAILRELYRVSARLVVLVEPAYELAPPEAQRRMEELGYCRNLEGTARQLGYQIMEHRPLPVGPFRANNPIAITVIQKSAWPVARSPSVFACPLYKTPLEKMGSVYYSPEGLVAYPSLDGIACLRAENAILASALPEFHS